MDTDKVITANGSSADLSKKCGQIKKIECERECYAMHSSGKNSLAVGLSPYKIAKKDAFASKLAGRLFSPFCMARSVHKILVE